MSTANMETVSTSFTETYAHEMYSYIFSQVTAAKSGRPGWFRSTSDDGQRKDFFLDDLSEVISYCKSGKRYEPNTAHLVTTLTEGMKNGSIVISTVDDVGTLNNIIDSTLRPYARASEYYAKTGQLFEINERLNDRSVFSTIHALRCSLYGKLYSYEISKVEEYLAAGEGPTDFMRLPVEVKMEFAGLADMLPVNGGDLERFFKPEVDHRDVFAQYGYMMPWLVVDENTPEEEESKKI